MYERGIDVKFQNAVILKPFCEMFSSTDVDSLLIRQQRATFVPTGRPHTTVRSVVDRRSTHWRQWSIFPQSLPVAYHGRSKSASRVHDPRLRTEPAAAAVAIRLLRCPSRDQVASPTAAITGPATALSECSMGIIDVESADSQAAVFLESGIRRERHIVGVRRRNEGGHR